MQEAREKFTESGLSTKYLPHASLPAGWRLGEARIGGNKTIKRYLSPDGKLFNNRALAMKQLLETGGSQQERDVMEQGFPADGWRSEDCLPAGWRMKHRTNKGKVQFLDSEYNIIDGFPKFMEHLSKNHSSAEVQKVRDFFKKHKSENVNKEATVKPPVNESPRSASIQSLLPRVTVTVKEEGEGQGGEAELQWLEDPALPPGWRGCWVTSRLPGITGTKHFRLRSPDGKCHSSRAQALRHMTAHPARYPASQLELVAAGLASDGWRENSNLQPGWRWRRVAKMLYFLTPAYEQIRGIQSTAKHMTEKLRYSKEIVDKFVANFYRAPKGNIEDEKENLIEILEDESVEDFSFEDENKMEVDEAKVEKRSTDHLANYEWTKAEGWPPGWKVTHVKSSMKYSEKAPTIKKLLSPDGRFFSSTVMALKYMTESKKFSEEDIAQVRATLCEDGWKESEILPAGWLEKYIPNIILFISPDLLTFRSQKKVLNHISLSGQHSLEFIEELREKFVGYKSKLASKRKIDYDIGEEDESSNDSFSTSSKAARLDTSDSDLPPGWTTQLSQDGSETFCSPTGETFTTRLSVLQFLAAGSSSSSVISQVWNSLEREGWSWHSQLPPDWRVKHFPHISVHKFLTKEFTLLHSIDEAIKFIRNKSEEFTEENVKKFLKFHELSSALDKSGEESWQTDPSLPDGWHLRIQDCTELLRNTAGTVFEGRKEAIEHMISAQYSPGQIFQLWSTLHMDGWIGDEDHLPTGWKRKFFPATNSYHYLSPMMEEVTSSKALLVCVKSGSDYTSQDIEKVQNWIKNSLGDDLQ